ncbi:hypothetical protein [Shimazuella kribbensis]|uniref:hypothetical protein n=1 Tax=Shimazuella kribbensis TaxID=139808 RepID=UPI0004175026|nr:hypothetical protein [Shimazuella kribbensis]
MSAKRNVYEVYSLAFQLQVAKEALEIGNTDQIASKYKLGIDLLNQWILQYKTGELDDSLLSFPTSIDIDVDPPNGITGFPQDMPAEDLKASATELMGKIRVSDEGSDQKFRSMKVLALHSQFEIVFHIENGKTLSASEIWIPDNSDSIRINIRFRGIDIFRTPALQLLKQIENMGYQVINQGDYCFVPKLSLGFTRVAGHEVPLDTDGYPLYFQAVLTGPTNYYDFLLERD